MADVAVLGIKVENGQVIKATASLEGMAVAGAKAEAATGRVSRRMGLAEIEARKMDAALEGAGRSSFKLTGGLGGLAGALQVVAGALAIRQLVELSNEYTNLHNRLALVTTGSENLAAVQASLFRVSQDTRTELEANVTLYSALARSTKALGLSQQDLVAITATVSGALITGGASASEANSSIRQLSQAFASGVLRGDEFNSMAENAPRLQQLLADSLGVSIGQLRAMAEAGELTSSRLATAFLGGTQAVRHEVEGMGLSISQAITQIKNAVLLYVGAADQAKGASSSIAEGLSMFAEKIPSIVKWVQVFAESWGLAATAMSVAAQTMKNLVTGNAGLNPQLWAYLLEEREALKKLMASAPATPGKPGTTRGTPVPLGPSAEEIERARKAAERLEHERLREEDQRQRAEERYVDDINAIWDKGMADVVASTQHGFGAVVRSVDDFIGALLERMQKEGRASLGLQIAGQVLGSGIAGATAGFGFGQSLFSTSHGGGGNTVRGAVGGAAAGAAAGSMIAPGIGTAIGAMAGFVGGILGVGSAAKDAGRQMAEAVKQVTLSMDALRATVKGDTLAQGIAAIEADREQRRKMIEDAWSGGDANSDRVRWRTQKLAEMNALEDERIRQLQAEYALTQKRAYEDLRVRDLASTGRSREAEALALQLQQQREMEQYVKDNADPATIALLAQVQAQEKLAAATNRATTSALNMVEGYNIVAEAFRLSGNTSGMTMGGGYGGASYTGPTQLAVPTGGSRGTPQPVAPIIIENIMQLDGREIARNTKKVFIDDATRSGDGDAYNWGRG